MLGLRNVSPGAYITPQTSLATLQQINKIKIDFTVPEQYTPFIKKGKEENGKKWLDLGILFNHEEFSSLKSSCFESATI